MVLAALRLADCLLTAESSLLDPHPFPPMQLPALQLPLAGQSKDRDSSLTGLIGPLCLLGLATPQLTASKPGTCPPLACSLPLLLPAFWLLDYLLAAETGFRRLCYSFCYRQDCIPNYMRI